MCCIFTPKMNVLGVLVIDDCAILVQSDLAVAASINTTYFCTFARWDIISH